MSWQAVLAKVKGDLLSLSGTSAAGGVLDFITERTYKNLDLVGIELHNSVLAGGSMYMLDGDTLRFEADANQGVTLDNVVRLVEIPPELVKSAQRLDYSISPSPGAGQVIETRAIAPVVPKNTFVFGGRARGLYAVVGSSGSWGYQRVTAPTVLTNQYYAPTSESHTYKVRNTLIELRG